MLRLSKTQFNRAIEGKPVVITEGYASPPSPHKSKRASTILITALIATIGIGAGWIGGKVLNARIGSGPVAAPPSDGSTGQITPPGSPSQSPAPQFPSAGKRSSGAENPSDPQSEPAAETEPPVATAEPAPKEAASREAPPKVPRVDKDEEEAEKTTAEDPSKEIGRKALKKMSKEINKMKRDAANKNENDPNQ